MTQSKNKDDSTFTINLNDTYGTTTTYSTNDTITITGSDSIYTGYAGVNPNFNMGNVTVSGIDISTLTTGDITAVNWDKFNTDVLWENKLPDPARVEKMCKHYPALEKAYENFKSIYKMVEQDYKGNHEDKDDALPF